MFDDGKSDSLNVVLDQQQQYQEEENDAESEVLSLEHVAEGVDEQGVDQLAPGLEQEPLPAFENQDGAEPRVDINEPV